MEQAARLQMTSPQSDTESETPSTICFFLVNIGKQVLLLRTKLSLSLGFDNNVSVWVLKFFINPDVDSAALSLLLRFLQNQQKQHLFCFCKVQDWF